MLNKMMHLSRWIPKQGMQMYGHFGGIFHTRSALFGIDGYDDPSGVSIFWSLGQLREELWMFFFKESLLGGSS